MGTGNPVGVLEEETGVVHRAIKDIFDIIKVGCFVAISYAPCAI